MNQKQLEKEWKKMEKAEAAYLKRNMSGKDSSWQDKIEKYVPEKFESTLEEGFFKAFRLIFDKGTPVIEKTYNKKKREQDYKIHEYAAELKNNRKSVKAFGQTASKSQLVNSAISTVEGVGFGIFGVGIPDIPVFIGVLLKSVYEIALSYGFSYDSEKEQIFILKIIETAMLQNKELESCNYEINQIIDGREKIIMDKEKQMRDAAGSLAKEMLYLKFVQTVPVAGVIGGAYDVVFQRKISSYAKLKYTRRFCNRARQEEFKGGI